MSNSIPEMTDEELNDFAEKHALLIGQSYNEVMERLMHIKRRYSARLPEEGKEKASQQEQVLRLRGHGAKPRIL